MGHRQPRIPEHRPPNTDHPAPTSPSQLSRAMGLALAVLLCICASAADIPDFSFLHCSDIHLSAFGSDRTATLLKDFGEIRLTPYNVTAKPPSFILVTGDLTEFGGGSGWWGKYLGLWAGISLPVYQILGNHDSTWDSCRWRLRKLHGQPYYSFDRFGCHFAGLDTATPQDPRPSIGEEQLLWLRKDLEAAGREKPVFLFFHHPLGTREFASRYDSDRLADVLRPYNIALLLVGHGHVARHQVYSGLDQTMGGSTLKPMPGIGIVSVLSSTLRVAYRPAGEQEAILGVLEKPLPAKPSYPTITIEKPAHRATAAAEVLIVEAHIVGLENIAAAEWIMDESPRGPLIRAADRYRGEIPTRGWLPGAHCLRVNLTDAAGAAHHRSSAFFFETGRPRTLWRAFMGGSSQCTPTISRGTVFVGANDGALYAFNAADGRERWRFQTGGEILAQPLVHGDTLFVASGDGNLYALAAEAAEPKPKWVFPAESALYSSPVYSDGLLLFGCNDGTFHAVDAATGLLRWQSREPTCTIESKPFVADGVVYFGAWDRHVYALNVADGSLRWKALSVGSDRNVAPRYYSPADCGPVVVEGRVAVTDRAFKLTILDAAQGTRLASYDKCAAVSRSADGKSLYCRQTDGKLAKTDWSGQTLWRADVKTGMIPAAPTEADGVVYVSSNAGLVSAVSADTGAIRWQYQATPQLYVMSSVAAADGVAYVSGMDGSLTAIDGRAR